MIKNNVSIIAAVSDNGVIGKNNGIPWRQKTDIQNFRALTTGNIVIMGSRTFESLDEKPLSNRINMVLTSNIDKYRGPYEGAISFITSYDDILFHAFRFAEHNKLKIFIIGGQNLYEQAIIHPSTKEMFITKIHSNIDGDAYFPMIDKSWDLMSVTNFSADESNDFNYSYYHYKK